jgi:hypothetical protein
MTLLDLQPFCSTCETRPQLARPYNLDGWTYATDGRICLRVPALADTEPNTDSPPPPNPAELFNQPLAKACDENLAPFPTLPDAPPRVYCHECNGEGFVRCECCNHEKDCDNCTNGTEAVLFPWRVGGQYLNLHYLRKIEGLPGLIFHALPAPVPSLFRFNGGGEGLISPMNLAAIKDSMPTFRRTLLALSDIASKEALDAMTQELDEIEKLALEA